MQDLVEMLIPIIESYLVFIKEAVTVRYKSQKTPSIVCGI